MGLLLTKELILIDKNAHSMVRDLKLRSVPMLRADTQLYDMLRLFETGAVSMLDRLMSGVKDGPMCICPCLVFSLSQGALCKRSLNLCRCIHPASGALTLSGMTLKSAKSDTDLDCCSPKQRLTLPR